MDLPEAPGTNALIIANLIASLYGLLVDRKFQQSYLFNVGALIRNKEHYRIFTSSFLHGDLFHLGFNMMTLFFFGPAVEEILGTTGFLVVYFGAVFTSGVLSFYVNKNNYAYSSLGASDGVSGVILSFCVFYPFSNIYLFLLPIGIPAFIFAGLFIAISLSLMGRDGNRISHEGHLGGAAAGLLLTIVMKPAVVAQFFA